MCCKIVSQHPMEPVSYGKRQRKYFIGKKEKDVEYLVGNKKEKEVEYLVGNEKERSSILLE